MRIVSVMAPVIWYWRQHITTHNYNNMKIKKSVLKAMALAIVISAAGASCTKDSMNEKSADNKKTDGHENYSDCPACGMG